MIYDETYSLTKDELRTLSEDFQQHVKQHGGNDGRYKMPRHWMKIQIFAPPRAGCLYKGYQCACGYEFYLRRK